MSERNGVQINLSHPCSPLLPPLSHFSLHSLAFRYHSSVPLPALPLVSNSFQRNLPYCCPPFTKSFLLVCDYTSSFFPLFLALWECSQVYTAERCPFPHFPSRPHACCSHLYSPLLSSKNTKGYLICGLCLYLIVCEEVYILLLLQKASFFLKFSISSLAVCCNL